MFFEAELKGQKYKITVFEQPNTWEVTLTNDGAEENFSISKLDYQKIDGAICFLFNNNSYMVDVVGSGTNSTVYTRGSFRDIVLYNDELLLHESLKGGSELGGGNQATSGMPGKIVKVLVKEGDRVSAGELLLVMEAMKMENDIKAPRDVTIREVKVSKGDSVETGETLVIFE